MYRNTWIFRESPSLLYLANSGYLTLVFAILGSILAWRYGTVSISEGTSIPIYSQSKKSHVEIANDFLWALQTSNFDRLLSYLSEDAQIVGASGTNYTKKDLEQYFSQFENPFREVNNELVGTYTYENYVIIESVLNAVQEKEYLGIPPAKKLFKLPTLNVFEIENDKISAWRQYQNTKILLDLHA
jgi:steroid delta-isomerase-like uncharacterized protein